MSTSIPYSKQEIESCIMAGVAKYEEDKGAFQQRLGSSDGMAFLGATWKKLKNQPEGVEFLKKNQPDVYRQAVSMFGE